MHPSELDQASAEEVLACLPWRRELHEAELKGNPILADLLTNPRKRAADIGLSCLTAYDVNPNQQTLKLLRMRRGQSVGVLADRYHVVPSGMFACCDRENRLDSGDLQLALHKELLEELFDGDEADGSWGRERVRTHVAERLHQLLFLNDPQGQQVTIALTGFVIDLLNLRPEFTAISLVRNPEVGKALDQRRKPNWESAEIDSDSLAKSLNPPLKAFQWVQSGAAAWNIGVDWIERHCFTD